MNKKYALVILMAGTSTRVGKVLHKPFLMLNQKPIINHVLDTFLKIKTFHKIIIVYHKNDLILLNNVLKEYDSNFILIEGKASRNESLIEGLKQVTEDYVLVHDAARPYTSINDINRIIEEIAKVDATTLYHDVVDAIKLRGKSLPKNELKAVTTPQAFNKKAYGYILNHPDCYAADELEVLENDDFKISYVKETNDNKKITYLSDLTNADYLVGHSMDFHQFVKKDYLTLGGVRIPSEFGLLGHSDADCVYHSVAEAILGALHLKDLGDNFPDSDSKYQDIDSKYFLEFVKNELSIHHYKIVNIDIMIYLEKPKLKEYKALMEQNIANIFEMDSNKVTVKATTYEKQGVIGSSQGIASHAFVLLKKD